MLRLPLLAAAVVAVTAEAGDDDAEGEVVTDRNVRIATSLATLRRAEKWGDAATAERFRARGAALAALAGEGGQGAGLSRVVVKKEVGAPVGGHFGTSTLHLLKVTPGGALDRAGGSSYVGRRLVTVAGQPVKTLPDLRRVARPLEVVELGFELTAPVAQPVPVPRPRRRDPTPTGTPAPATPASRRVEELFSIVNTASRPMVVFAARGGLGNRLGGLLEAAAMAFLLGASLHVAWNSRHDECRAELGQLLATSPTEVTVEPPDSPLTPEELALGPAAAFFDLALVAPPLWPMAARHRMDRDKEQGIRTPADREAVATMYHHPPTPSSKDARRLPLRLRSSRGLPPLRLPPRGQASLHPVVTWAAQLGRPCLILWHNNRVNADPALLRTAAAHYKLAPAPKVASAATQFMLQNRIDPEVVGVHLRATDAKDPVDVEQVVAGLKEKFGGKRFFVCSDDKEVENTVVGHFASTPGRAVRLEKKSYPVRADPARPWRLPGGDAECNCTFNVRRDATSVEEAMVDLLILANTHLPQVIPGATSQSAFRWAARWLSDAGVVPEPPPTPPPPPEGEETAGPTSEGGKGAAAGGGGADAASPGGGGDTAQDAEDIASWLENAGLGEALPGLEALKLVSWKALMNSNPTELQNLGMQPQQADKLLMEAARRTGLVV
eukprot:TRINITY_DN55440_c0_g1_i1.p1 TRINITY_DN55440_c0_g1~~TRINITY_DN55440_c0_g1_i1.p1  ORF type:complete len:694 (+),score=158.00 TRINITY_DN55440_c0_g1_i1:81-2084(+)